MGTTPLQEVAVMPRLRNATRDAAVALAQKIAMCEETSVNVYESLNEGPGVWYVRFWDVPAPPNCACAAQIMFGPGPSNMEESDAS
jgi:hypothetical protein